MNLHNLFEMSRGERLVTRLRRALARKLTKVFGQTDQEALVNSTRFYPEGMSDDEARRAAHEAGIELNGNSENVSDEELYRQMGLPPVFSGSGKKMPDPAIDVKDVDQLDQTMSQHFGNLEKAATAAKNLTHIAGPDERGTKIFSVPETMRAIRSGKMTPQRLIADLIYNKIHNTPLMSDALDAAEITTREIFTYIDSTVDLWFDDILPNMLATNVNIEQWQLPNKTMYYIPSDSDITSMATRYTQDMLQQHNQRKKYESVNESVNTHDKLVATVANYMYVKHPEIFTHHGDGYVMTVVDDVVSKWEQQDEPMQDIKAYALEVMDALSVDRTNENRAQIKTDYKGHHLVNADGEEVQSYPKDAEGLKKARNTLYINHKGLNTMKQEGLNEAFDAALEKLSLDESVTINTTTTSEGQDTVTVTATDEDAYELVNILKAAGIPHDKAQQYAPAPCDAAIAMPVEEEFANEPHDDCCNGDMDHMNTQSGGLNRRKMQQKYANPLGDNPLAESDDLLRGLWDLYKEAK
jgi:hypothetical protein